MKVEVLGNGLTWFARPNTNFLVDKKILVDVPQSNLKFLFGKVDFSKIEVVLITHFHSDHFGDLHLLYSVLRRARKTPVKVVAPKKAFKRLMKMFKLIDNTEEEYSKKEVRKVFEFIELKPNQFVDVAGYKIRTYSVEHGLKYGLGYTITNKVGATVGFTGDTKVCDGLFQLIEDSQTIFIEASTIKPSKTHLTVSEVSELINKYKSKTFYAVHVTDEILKKYQKKINIPDCGSVITVENNFNI